MGRFFGIDFGTTNTVISYRNQKGKIKRIRDGGESCIKTAIFFESPDVYFIGNEAYSRRNLYPQAICTGFKPRIKGENYYITAADGTSFKLNPVKAVRLFLNKLLKDHLENTLEKVYHEPELSAEDCVVVTVPVKFNPEEKKAIKQAALKANYPNLKIAFEPTAAAVAIAEGEDNVEFEDDDIIAVYDLGGGTFDISVIEKKDNGVYYPLDKGQDGDKTLGGDLITRKIMEMLFDELENEGLYFSGETDDEDFEFDPDEFGTEISEYFYNWTRLKSLADNIKKTFSEYDISEDYFDCSFQWHGEEKHLQFKVTEEQYNNCISKLIKRTVDITERVINDTETANSVHVSKLVLAGGSSQIRLIYDMLEERFSGRNIQILRSRRPFELISTGALLLAEKGSDFLSEEKTVSQFGVAEKKGMAVLFTPLIMEESRLPVEGKRIFDISEDVFRSGEISVRFYEKDVRSYPDSKIIGRDEGLYRIAEYNIPIDKDIKPKMVEITFVIEEDGTIRLKADFMDINGDTIRKIDDCRTVESNLE